MTMMSLRDIQREYWPRDEVSAFWEKCPLSLLINQTDINSWNLNPIKILLQPLFSSQIILWDKLYLSRILVIHQHKPLTEVMSYCLTPYRTPLSLLLASIRHWLRLTPGKGSSWQLLHVMINWQERGERREEGAEASDPPQETREFGWIVARPWRRIVHW